MPDGLSFAAIEEQHAELLPARTVLSVFSLDGDDTVVADSCQSTYSAGTGGLLGLLGLGAGPHTTETCTPAVVVTNSGEGTAG
jgi:hypothetical protein